MSRHRPLGATGLSIAPLVLGGNVFGVNGMDRARSFAVLDAFVAAGGTMIDTADIYANYLPGGKGGESETMIGDWLAHRGRRDDVQIATKGGGPMVVVPVVTSPRRRSRNPCAVCAPITSTCISRISTTQTRHRKRLRRRSTGW